MILNLLDIDLTGQLFLPSKFYGIGERYHPVYSLPELQIRHMDQMELSGLKATTAKRKRDRETSDKEQGWPHAHPPE